MINTRTRCPGKYKKGKPNCINSITFEFVKNLEFSRWYTDELILYFISK
jgi:hypothetical protein